MSFDDPPRSVPAPRESNGRSSLIMSVTERRLYHDVIELKDAQQHLAGDIAALKSEVGALTLTVQQKRIAGTGASEKKLELSASPSPPLEDSSVAAGPPTTVLFPGHSPSAESTDTEEFAKDLAETFTQIDTRLTVEIARLQGQLNSLRQESLKTLTWLDADLNHTVQSNSRAVGVLREEIQAWKAHHEHKFVEISETLKTIETELPSWRSLEKSGHDRSSALEVREWRSLEKPGHDRSDRSSTLEGREMKEEIMPRQSFGQPSPKHRSRVSHDERVERASLGQTSQSCEDDRHHAVSPKRRSIKPRLSHEREPSA